MSAYAPGKLFIAGEYAVVTPGEPAVLIAVNRGITVHVEPQQGGGAVNDPLYREPLRWTRQPSGDLAWVHGGDDLVARTVAVCDRYARAKGLPPIDAELSIESELVDAEGHKFGLGSSAAVAVATVAAISVRFSLGLSRVQTYKLAYLATLERSSRASGGDIAASVFGGWVWYRSPDRAAVIALVQHEGLVAALESEWPLLELTRLPEPQTLHLGVGWTGVPASTGDLVAHRTHYAEAHATLCTTSRVAVHAMRDALDAGDDDGVLRAFTASQRALAHFDTATGGGIETERLARLRQIATRYGVPAKVSGAGGGDCGVALSKSYTALHRIREEWRAEGIVPLDLTIHHAGVQASAPDREV